MVSLARAFTCAGSESVVMSLWKVDDASTLEIMSAFFKYLSIGTEKSEALAIAKRDYRTNHPTAPPYYWAGFVLVGDNLPLTPVSDYRWLWYVIVGMVITLTMVLFFRRRFA